PVLTSTLRRFAERFGPAGYRESALIPCYGMAEATLFVSGKPDGTSPRSTWLDKAALEQGGATAATAGAAGATEVMSCGAVAHGHEVVIVDSRSRRPVPPGTVGEIWVAGPNVAHGYFGRPELTAGAFQARLDGARDGSAYLRTGDAGFLMDGELYVTGRLKDVIIIAGRNLYPQDIEVSVLAASDDLRRAAAFAVRPGDGEEQLVVVAELRRAGQRGEQYLAGLRDRVTAAVAAGHAVRPALVHLGPPGTIATTTSGKVRRSATRQAYQDGTLKELAPARAAELAASAESAR
ncbi:MAG TPA: AMP-binding protein, partial [Streptosporangiaceae bacterium]